MELFEKTLTFKFFQKAHVDEFFRLFAFRGGDARGDLLDCIADAFKVGMGAIVGYLQKTFMSRFENFRVGGLEIFSDYFFRLFIMGGGVVVLC
jgi:hypothetical protein